MSKQDHLFILLCRCGSKSYLPRHHGRRLFSVGKAERRHHTHAHARTERGISNRATDRVGDRRVASSSSSSNSNGPGTLERLRLRRQWPIHDLSRSRARRGCELFCLLARGVERTKKMPKRGEASECEEGVLLQGPLRHAPPLPLFENSEASNFIVHKRGTTRMTDRTTNECRLNSAAAISINLLGD